jgi:hypothetical protein
VGPVWRAFVAYYVLQFVLNGVFGRGRHRRRGGNRLSTLSGTVAARSPDDQARVVQRLTVSLSIAPFTR